MTRDEQLLIDRKIDGTLRPENFPALQRLLAADDAALAYYCDQAAVHGGLEWQFSASGNRMKAVKRKSQLVEEKRMLQQRRAVGVSLAIAAVLVIVLGLSFHMVRSHLRPQMDLAFNQAADYRIERQGGGTGEDADTLTSGDRLILSKGAAEFTLSLGIRAVIEAPAEITLLGRKHIGMKGGRGYFEITGQAGNGFTVTLPGAEIVDLGTRFGVLDEEGKPAEIHVLEGHVRVKRIPKDGGGFGNHPVLVANQAVREDDGSKNGFSFVTASASRFSTVLPGDLDHTELTFDKLAPDGSIAATGLRDTGKVELVLMNGGILETAPGKIGRAMRFDGSGSFIRVSGWKGISGDHPRTVCFWAKFPHLDPLPASRGMSLLTWGNPTNEINRRWELNVNSGASSPTGVIRTTTGSDNFAHGSTNLYDGRWHHIASTYDPDAPAGGKLVTYIDGEPEETKLNTLREIETGESGSFQIGKNLSPVHLDSFPLEGLLDEIHIFGRALGKSEIRAIASDARSGEQKHKE